MLTMKPQVVDAAPEAKPKFQNEIKAQTANPIQPVDLVESVEPTYIVEPIYRIKPMVMYIHVKFV